MEFRFLQYFLAIVREGSITAAAEALHISQPALSRQMHDLEEELGVTLFERGNRRITLTEEGMIFRKRAEEILQLMHQTREELTDHGRDISGDIYIGAGESWAFHQISRTIGELTATHPDIHIHIISGDTTDLLDKLDHGLLDAAMVFSEFDRSVYNYHTLPEEDCFGVLMRKDAPLAAKDVLTLRDLKDQPLILSRSSVVQLRHLDLSRLNIVGTYNLIYNASLMVEDGIGYALTFDKLINTSGDSPLCFRPLIPKTAIHGSVIWKKYAIFSPAVQTFMDILLRNVEPAPEA